MSSSTEPRLKNIKGGPWRIELRGRVGRIRLHLETPAAQLDPALKDQAEQHLNQVEALVQDWQTPAEWWSGSQVELAWTEMRLAEESLLLAETSLPAVIGNGRATLAAAKGRLTDGDDRVRALATELNAINPPGGGPTPAGATGALAQRLTVDVAHAYFDVSNAEHRTQRQLRNVLRLLVIMLGILALVVAVLGLWVSPPPGFVTVPKGITTAGQAVATALGLGAFGALFSAIPSLAAAPPNATTFNPRTEQAALKVLVGAWSGLVGLVAMTAGLAASASTTPSLSGFAILCAGFGATQEAITRFADQKAADTKPGTS